MQDNNTQKGFNGFEKQVSTQLSKNLFAHAKNYIPGGVNSPVRAFSQMGREPVFIKKANGAYLVDVDKNEYVDYCLSWGVAILGHANKTVNKAAHEAIKDGSSYGAATEHEVKLARNIFHAIPSMQKLRLVSSGTEAVMSALRLARAFTRKRYIVKFDGCYHGHSDFLLVSAGSGVADLYQSSSAGVLPEFVQFTISIPYNNIDAVKEVFMKFPDDIACVIIEPIAANMGLVLPNDGYLEFLRSITSQYNSLLVFDEVITGFRNLYGGIQKHYNVNPDLTTLGKIIGGGFPIGAYGGSTQIMDMIAPLGPVYQAGTLSGNPVAVRAGLATLNQLSENGFYNELNHKTTLFVSELKDIFKSKPVVVNHIGSMFSIFFGTERVSNYDDVRKCDHQWFVQFYNKLLNEGVYFSPSSFETNFLSSAHTNKLLEKTLKKVKKITNNY